MPGVAAAVASLRYEISENEVSYFVGVDVGGTTTTIAIGNVDRQVKFVSAQFETRSVEGPEATIGAIVREISAGIERLGVSADQIEQIGLATPGPATRDGVLLNSPNLNPKLWNNFGVRRALEDRMRQDSPGVSVQYIGDGQSAAFGEYSIRTRSLTWEGVSRSEAERQELSSLFMTIVGTGLGGGAVRMGRPVCGSQGRAGHAGHIFLPAAAFRYEHDQQLIVGNAPSTVESAVSLTALTHQLDYRLSLEQWSDHSLKSAPGSTRDKAKQLRELAGSGDELALQLFDDQARCLGIGMLAANYLGDYDLLVIGGGVCDMTNEMRERYRKAAEQAYHDFALDGFRNLDRIEFSLCGDEAAVIGALAYAYSFATLES